MAESLFGFSVAESTEQGRRFLVIGSGSEAVRVIQYQVEMITNNNVPGLLPVEVRRKDNEVSIYCNIDGYVSLGAFLQQARLGKNDFLRLVDQIINTLVESQKFFLNQESFVLRDRYIYVKPDTKAIALLYLPTDVEQDSELALKDLVISLIAHLPGVDARDAQIGEFLNYLKKERVTLAELQRYLKRGRAEVAAGAEAVPLVQPPQHPVNVRPNPEPLKMPDKKVSDTVSNKGKAKPAPQPVSQKKKAAAKKVTPAKKKPGSSAPKSNTRTYILGAIAILAVVAAVISNTDPATLQTYLDSYLYIAGGAVLILVSLVIIVLLTVRSRKEKEAKDVQEVSEQLSRIAKTASGRPQDSILYEDLGVAAQKLDVAVHEYRPASAHPHSQPLPQPQRPPQPVVTLSSTQDDATELLDNGDTTVLLDQGPMAVLKTIRSGREERIPINKAEFYLGRNAAVVDWCIADDKSVGRVHAKIVAKDGVYWIVDLDSKNGTFLNGERLESNKPYTLKFTDKIKLANIEFTFEQG